MTVSEKLDAAALEYSVRPDRPTSDSEATRAVDTMTPLLMNQAPNRRRRGVMLVPFRRKLCQNQTSSNNGNNNNNKNNNEPIHNRSRNIGEVDSMSLAVSTTRLVPEVIYTVYEACEYDSNLNGRA